MCNILNVDYEDVEKKIEEKELQLDIDKTKRM